jgi:hypothetical protein
VPTARAWPAGSPSSAGVSVGLRARGLVEVEGEGAAVGQGDEELARAVLVGVCGDVTGGGRLGVKDDFLGVGILDQVDRDSVAAVLRGAVVVVLARRGDRDDLGDQQDVLEAGALAFLACVLEADVGTAGSLEAPPG